MCTQNEGNSIVPEYDTANFAKLSLMQSTSLDVRSGFRNILWSSREHVMELLCRCFDLNIYLKFPL
ncbi:hypothetical protein AtEden1_Chr1g0025721 [Arabidopsis thaliana]